MGMFCILHRVPENMFQELGSDPGKHLNYMRVQERIEGNPRMLDIDKAWHGVHFVLTGDDEIDSKVASEDPLTWVVFGRDRRGWITVGDVNRVSEALNRVTTKDFEDRFKSRDFDGKRIYPISWKVGEQDLEYLSRVFGELKEFYHVAAREGQGIAMRIF